MTTPTTPTTPTTSTDPTTTVPAAAAPAFGPPSSAAAQAIASTVALYADGLRQGDVHMLMQAFSDDAVVCGYIGDESFVKPVTFLYRFVLEQTPPARSGEPYTCETTSVQVAGGVAIVIVSETAYLGSDYVTTLHLIELDGVWTIVSKLFQGTAAA